ncbi:MAG: c-type cytochrome [Planctomycetes bacterium]|nr:c-type cytochrome [Planctomycetota bacterium]
MDHTDVRRWNAIRLRRTVALVLLLLLLQSCAGPQSLRVAIIPQDETDYVAFVNDADFDGRQAFANWMSQERGISLEEFFRLDAELCNNRNPFDAYKDMQAVSRGAVIYKFHCMRCHGSDARGRGPAALASYPANDFKTFGSRFAATLHRGAPRKWFRVIRDGAGDVVEYPEEETTAMPPFGDKLAREQIWLTIAYLQSLDVHATQDVAEQDR